MEQETCIIQEKRYRTRSPLLCLHCALFWLYHLFHYHRCPISDFIRDGHQRNDPIYPPHSRIGVNKDSSLMGQTGILYNHQNAVNKDCILKILLFYSIDNSSYHIRSTFWITSSQLWRHLLTSVKTSLDNCEDISSQLWKGYKKHTFIV